MKEVQVSSILAAGLSVIIALAFILNGWQKIVPSEEVQNNFIEWGYSTQFATLIGALEIVGAILVLIPKTALYGALLLAAIMGGAIYTHLTTQLGSPAFAIILLLLTVVLCFLRWKSAFLISGMVNRD